MAETEPCAVCAHVHLHERCKTLVYGKDSGWSITRCGCCCYLTEAEALKGTEAYAVEVSHDG